MPVVHPVTTASLPLRSMPSVTSSAVEFSPKGLRGTPAVGTLSVPAHPATVAAMSDAPV
jgi:hypothetical protein